MKPSEFFSLPQHAIQKRYEALRAFYFEGKPADEVAKQFNYKINTVYSLARDFKKRLNEPNIGDTFFVKSELGRKPADQAGKVKTRIVELRKKYLSVPDIKPILDSQDYHVSERQIYNVIKQEGFARLPRRSRKTRKEVLGTLTIRAPKSALLESDQETFCTQESIGILCFLPYIKEFGIDRLITDSGYPETKTIPKLQSILSFVALKLSDMRRYTADDLWCMDRGLGLFAGLNVLPKTAWFSSYSSRVTMKENMDLLKGLNKIWVERGLLSDTANLDFASIPYWGDDSHLENNWSGTRHKAIPSLLAALAQDPESGIVTYGDTSIRHDRKNDVAIEFLDFYPSSGISELKYLVFDSKFTTYENLKKLDEEEKVKFITIRRRGKSIVSRLESFPADQWKKVRVPASNGKNRQLKVNDSLVFIKEYGKKLRQIAITGHGKLKPALIITNDFDLNLNTVIRKYARRWLIEKGISEQIYFFHLNRVSSSMVIKVDFDLVMTILAHNLYRLLAADLTGFEHNTAVSIFEKFLYNSGDIKINPKNITISMKKKRNLPALLTAMQQFTDCKVPWLDNRTLTFTGATRS